MVSVTSVESFLHHKVHRLYFSLSEFSSWESQLSESKEMSCISESDKACAFSQRIWCLSCYTLMFSSACAVSGWSFLSSNFASPSTLPISALTLNAPIATKVVCFSRLLKCLRSLYGKQCGPRSDCSYRSSLIWVLTVCFYT